MIHAREVVMRLASGGRVVTVLDGVSLEVDKVSWRASTRTRSRGSVAIAAASSSSRIT